MKSLKRNNQLYVLYSKIYLNKIRRLLHLAITKPFRIEEDKALHKNCSFWVVLIVPMVVIIWLSWKLLLELLNSNRIISSVSSDNLQFIVHFFAVPITCLTIPVTLTIMVNRFHSSKQKAKSNQLIEVNNAANNYFNHFDKFKEFVKTLESSNISINPYITYRLIFSESHINKFDIKVCPYKVRTIINELKDVVEYYERYCLDEGYTNKSKREIEKSLTFPNIIEGIHYKSQRYNSDPSLFRILQSQRELVLALLSFQGVPNHNEVSDIFITEYHRTILSKFDLQEKHLRNS